MERISSTTAAPNRLRPTRERSTPISIRVRAEILTLVAPNANPSNRAAEVRMPKSRPAPQPSAMERTSPPMLARMETLRWRVNSPRCNSKTGDEHQQQDAQVTQFRDGGPQVVAVDEGKMENVDQRGTEQHTDEQFAQHGRLTQAGAEITGSFGSQQDDDKFEGKLQEGGHGRESLSYPFSG